MSQAGTSRKKTRHWWEWFDNGVKRISAVVALSAAVFGLIKSFAGPNEIKTPGNNVLILDVTLIENQFQQVTGQPLKDPATKELLRSAVNLAKAHQYDESRKLFQQLAATVPVPVVWNNLGALEADKGDYVAAKEAYQQAVAKQADFAPALKNLEKLTTEKPHTVSVSSTESEPNNDFDRANEITVGSRVAAAISDGSDTDFYHFQTPRGPRDHYSASLENGGLTLRPSITVYSGNRSQVTANYSHEPLKQFEVEFPAEGETAYYVQVSGVDGTSGPYTLQIKPLKLYDRFEPNDNFVQAKTISSGTTIDANIMDGQDTDFYLVRSATTGQITARVENGGTTMRPSVSIFDSNRSAITANYTHEPLAHFDVPFPAQAGVSYYVQVSGMDGTSGAYKLTVK